MKLWNMDQGEYHKRKLNLEYLVKYFEGAKQMLL